MIAMWMLRMALASGLIAAAAWLVEGGLRRAGRARRWAWVAALATVIVAPLLAALVSFPLPGIRVIPGRVDDGAFGVDEIVARVTEMGGDAGLAAGDVLGLFWIFALLLALTVYAAGWWRLRAARRAWRRGRMAGASVLVSPRAGPAAVGVLQPAIVVPEWLLAEDESVQRLVVLHEAEHLAARDHLVLALAPLVVVLMPWNAALWWMVRRLRLAIELDCDSRVLARGVEPSAYGTLLLDVAGRNGKHALAIAMASPRSALEHRIEALAGAIQEGGRARLIAHASMALFCVMIACSVAPTALVEDTGSASDLAVGTMTGAEVVRRFAADGTRWMIDGEPVSEAAVLALGGDRIAAIRIQESIHGEDGSMPPLTDAVVNIVTPHYVTLHPEVLDARSGPRRTGEKPLDRIRNLLADPDLHIVIDGRESDRASLESLTNADIAKLEVTRRRVGDTVTSGISVETQASLSN